MRVAYILYRFRGGTALARGDESDCQMELVVTNVSQVKTASPASLGREYQIGRVDKSRVAFPAARHTGGIGNVTRFVLKWREVARFRKGVFEERRYIR